MKCVNRSKRNLHGTLCKHVETEEYEPNDYMEEFGYDSYVPQFTDDGETPLGEKYMYPAGGNEFSSRESVERNQRFNYKRTYKQPRQRVCSRCSSRNSSASDISNSEDDEEEDDEEQDDDSQQSDELYPLVSKQKRFYRNREKYIEQPPRPRTRCVDDCYSSEISSRPRSQQSSVRGDRTPKARSKISYKNTDKYNEIPKKPITQYLNAENDKENHTPRYEYKTNVKTMPSVKRDDHSGDRRRSYIVEEGLSEEECKKEYSEKSSATPKIVHPSKYIPDNTSEQETKLKRPKCSTKDEYIQAKEILPTKYPEEKKKKSPKVFNKLEEKYTPQKPGERVKQKEVPGKPTNIYISEGTITPRTSPSYEEKLITNKRVSAKQQPLINYPSRDPTPTPSKRETKATPVPSKQSHLIQQENWETRKSYIKKKETRMKKEPDPQYLLYANTNRFPEFPSKALSKAFDTDDEDDFSLNSRRSSGILDSDYHRSRSQKILTALDDGIFPCEMDEKKSRKHKKQLEELTQFNYSSKDEYRQNHLSKHHTQITAYPAMMTQITTPNKKYKQPQVPITSSKTEKPERSTKRTAIKRSKPM